MGGLFPGGYVFSGIVFWGVVGLVAVGTMVVPMALTVGAALMVLESLGRGR